MGSANATELSGREKCSRSGLHQHHICRSSQPFWRYIRSRIILRIGVAWKSRLFHSATRLFPRMAVLTSLLKNFIGSRRVYGFMNVLLRSTLTQRTLAPMIPTEHREVTWANHCSLIVELQTASPLLKTPWDYQNYLADNLLGSCSTLSTVSIRLIATVESLNR